VTLLNSFSSALCTLLSTDGWSCEAYSILCSFRCNLSILRISLACVRPHQAGAAYSILDIIIASVTFWIASFRRPWALRILHRVYPLDLYLLAWAVYRRPTCGSCASLRLILTSCLNQEIIFLSKFRNIP